MPLAAVTAHGPARTAIAAEMFDRTPVVTAIGSL
jgi:hypothetical protein